MVSKCCALSTAVAMGQSLFLVVAAAEPNKPESVVAPASSWTPAVSLTLKESYDDNLFGVSGNGLSPKSSWITTISPKVGFDFALLLVNPKTLQTLSLSYAPDLNFYHDDPSQNYNAHRISNAVKGQAGDFSFLVDNAFLYNDGTHRAPIYALKQGASAVGQLD